MSVASKVRAVRRRARCARRGHYWLQRLDADLNVQVFCRRCGRRDASAVGPGQTASSRPKAV